MADLIDLEKIVQIRINHMDQQIANQDPQSTTLHDLQSKRNKYLHQKEIVYLLINYIEMFDGHCESQLTRTLIHFKRYSNYLRVILAPPSI